MEKITIPNKTFSLYKKGLRTFIHILRDEMSVVLKENLKFGDAVTLVNKDTQEEMIQTFWFLFDYKKK